ncbi:MAG TPA: signal recognition particle-docking protein FtsY [archaeon]|nr:signal recognition particle-docking protein FtsY [archaeon]
MFDSLKKKLSKLVDVFSKKIEKKEEKKEEQVQKVEEVVKKIEPQILEGNPEQIIEEIKEKVEAKVPEIKEKVEEVIKEITPVAPPVEEEEKEILEKIDAKHEPEIEKIIEEPKPEIKIETKKEKKSWIKKISEKIVKTITEKNLDEKDVEPFLDDLERELLESDVALEVVEKIKKDLKIFLTERTIQRGHEKEYILDSIRKSLEGILSLSEIDLKAMGKTKKPFVILFLGFNGNGKTTTIAKVAKWMLDNKFSCVISASDCFRAAAIDQIEEHSNKLGVRLIKHTYGADPAAVAFDAISHAKANGIDFVLIDTAGRTQNNVNLMREMEKIVRVSKPDLKVLVIDSLIGNDAVAQAKTFNEMIGIDSVIFTKTDINPKGGSILSISYMIKKPILFVTVGQEHEDIRSFSKKWFIDQLLGNKNS